MAHVVQDVQQHYLMHLVRKSLGGDTMYVIFDFKQKFLSKGFREGGRDRNILKKVPAQGADGVSIPPALWHVYLHTCRHPSRNALLFPLFAAYFSQKVQCIFCHSELKPRPVLRPFVTEIIDTNLFGES